jgi:hypothetical protein
LRHGLTLTLEVLTCLYGASAASKC